VIVTDASVVIEILLRTPHAAQIERRVFASSDQLAAPALLDVEVAQVLRRYVMRGELSEEHGRLALGLFARFPIRRLQHGALLTRIWELRENLTAYDSAYVALAEALQATLLTRDRRLAAAPGHGASVEVI
jgi:predicted nucleic acid-binding protein